MVRAQDAFQRMREAADEGRLADAARIFFEDITLANGDEVAILSASGAFEFTAPNIPVIIRDIAQWGLPRPSHMLLLERITTPVLILHGSRTHRLYADVVRHLAGQLANSHVHEIPDAGHFTPMFAPDAVAGEFARFFTAAPAGA